MAVLLQLTVVVEALAEATEVAMAIHQVNPPGGRFSLLCDHALFPFVSLETVLSR